MDPGRHLRTDGREPSREVEHERQRRLGLPGVEHASSLWRPSGRVQEGALDAGQVGRGGVLVPDDGLGPVPQVDRGDGGRDLVAFDGQHLEVETGQGHRVTADAAAEVGNPLHPGRREALRVPRRDVQAGGLLEPGGGEQHAVGERAELRPGAGAQP
jgi:hypothetical protein